MGKIKVVLDPGHGGKDRKNGGRFGYVEADGVLAICKYLKEELDTTGAFDVTLTRYVDKFIELNLRGQAAAYADLFISQHTNGDASGTARGTEVFYSVDLLSDKPFATEMSAAIASTFGVPNRGAKTKESQTYVGEDYYTALDQAQDFNCKTCLIIESLFHSNRDDEAILLKDENLRKIAKIQATVICKKYGVTYPASVEWIEDINHFSDSPQYWIGKVENAKAGDPMLNFPKLLMQAKAYYTKK